MPIVYRSVKGSNLTAAEFDGNIQDLDGRVTSLENDLPEAISIDEFEVVGSKFYVHMSDATILGPYDFPVREWNFQNAGWLPLTDYYRNDVFMENGAVYIVTLDHESAASFDPNEAITAGNLYQILFLQPEAAIATGGDTGQVYRKQSDDDFDADWDDLNLEDLADVALLTGLSEGDALIFDGTDWTNGIPTIALDELFDVVISSTTLEDGQSLIYDGTSGDWVNDYPALATLSDVTVGGTASADGDVLKLRDDIWVNEPVDFSEITGSLDATQLPSNIVALGTSGTISLNPALSSKFSVTPAGHITLNAASAPFYGMVTLFITTSGTNSYNITFGTNFKSQGVLATGTDTAKTFAVHFVSNGANLIEVARTSAM